MNKSFLGYIGAGIGFAAATAVLTSCASSDKRETFSINGAGATFPAPLYQAWTQVFSRETGNKVNYQSTGSGSGVRQFAADTVDFGASDAARAPGGQEAAHPHATIQRLWMGQRGLAPPHW